MDTTNPGREVLKGESLDQRKGEILGIAGLMGSGRTELVSTLFGDYDRVVKGRIELDGKEIAIGFARDTMSHGISLVPEERKRPGLVLMPTHLQDMSVP